jgi:hypothetical protein
MVLYHRTANSQTLAHGILYSSRTALALVLVVGALEALHELAASDLYRHSVRYWPCVYLRDQGLSPLRYAASASRNSTFAKVTTGLSFRPSPCASRTRP